MTRYLLSFSGGKDSTATWLYVGYELGLDVEPVFAETGHESPELPTYLAYLEERLGPIARVQGSLRQLRKDLPDEPLTMLSLAKHKKRFPSATARFCTTELKLVPLRNHLQRRRTEEPGTEFVMCSGIRRQESPKRAQIAADRGWDDFMDAPLWLPILDWSHEEVFEAHRRHGIAPNPLYQEGMSRVGCWPCIMATKGDLRAMALQTPDPFVRLAAMEAEVCTFFSPDKTSQQHRSVRDPKSGVQLCTADDVRRWATGDVPAMNLFAATGTALPVFQDEGEDPFAPACSSVYGLCE